MIRPLLCSVTAFAFVTFFYVLSSDAAPAVPSTEDAMKYLSAYGYVSESSALSGVVNRESAIKEFQRFASLPQTGRLDQATLQKMSMPRCGVPDKMGQNELVRRKRYAFEGSRWGNGILTYRIEKYPQRRLHDTRQVDREFEKSFKYWSDVTNMKFVKDTKGPVNIEIRFEEGQHGDESPFDGPGKTLAHAFFPQHGGDAHFDDTEDWTINENQGTNLLQVAVHEFGHALGLTHSSILNSVMAPFYSNYIRDFKLDVDDIRGIQSLYGGYDLCQNPNLDAVDITADGKIFFFKGDFYWEISNEDMSRVLPGYPRKIEDDWDGVPGFIDAAVTTYEGDTYLLKGNQVWKFKNRDAIDGYPKDISEEFNGIPNNVDAAFAWQGNNATYFFKGHQYWKYDLTKNPRVEAVYPLNINMWPGVPNNIDAAVKWFDNNSTYFFKGDKYYKFDGNKNDVERDEYERATRKWWLGCSPLSEK